MPKLSIPFRRRVAGDYRRAKSQNNFKFQSRTSKSGQLSPQKMQMKGKTGSSRTVRQRRALGKADKNRNSSTTRDLEANNDSAPF